MSDDDNSAAAGRTFCNLRFCPNKIRERFAHNGAIFRVFYLRIIVSCVNISEVKRWEYGSTTSALWRDTLQKAFLSDGFIFVCEYFCVWRVRAEKLPPSPWEFIIVSPPHAIMTNGNDTRWQRYSNREYAEASYRFQ
jgi:hypothetical protein